MWTATREQLPDKRTIRIMVRDTDRLVAYTEVLDLWENDLDFCSYFNALLADAPFNAFRWETPAITLTSGGRPFEFVLLDDPLLDREPDAKAFSNHFGRAPNAEVVEFTNLGGDALMIVPRPIGLLSAYGHLAAFVRQAPELQQRAIWKMVGAAMKHRLGSKPVWLSTAGAGVSWLHVRLDDRPKYYGHGPYRAAP